MRLGDPVTTARTPSTRRDAVKVFDVLGDRAAWVATARDDVAHHCFGYAKGCSYHSVTANRLRDFLEFFSRLFRCQFVRHRYRLT